MRKITVKKNENYIVKIESLSQDGAGVGRISGFVVFCEGLLPGETAEVRIIKLTSSYAIGKTLRIIDSSPDRVEPQCSYSKECGGCSFFHFKYDSQLKNKEQYVVDCLSRIGGIVNYTLMPVRGMKDPVNYRNKAQYPIGYDKDGNVVTGFYAKASHRLVPVESCLIEDVRANKIRSFVAKYIQENNISLYNEFKHEGLVRNILIRTSSLNDSVMLIIVMTDNDFPEADKFISELTKECTDVVSVYFNINPKATNVILGDKYIHVYGEKRLEDAIDGVRFLLSPASFFQVNPSQTTVLYDLVAQFAELKETDDLLDIYCGIGTIGIYLAKKHKIRSLTGIEYVEQAIEDAKINAKINDVDNSSFYAGDAKDVAKNLVDKHFDVTVIDPPRKGCDEELLKLLVEISSDRIVYVSCNPATLARDLQYLSDNGYIVRKVCPVDLFPWTSHVECVTLMSKVEK